VNHFGRAAAHPDRRFGTPKPGSAFRIAKKYPEIGVVDHHMYDSRKAVFGLRYVLCSALELRSACQTAFQNCIQHVVSIHAVIVTLDAVRCMQCLHAVQSGARSAPMRHAARSAPKDRPRHFL